MPRFEPANYAANLSLLDDFATLAAEAGCTMGQLALAWLLARGEHVIPIPGTTSLAHLIENAGAAHVTAARDLMERVDALINQQTVRGARYSAATQAEVDTEQF
jgi:aryl-alcohol dehydrogenase-like predicted oxidoreductase